MRRWLDVLRVGGYTAGMRHSSEAEAALDDQMEQALQAVPAIRRWLLRSMPKRQAQEGRDPVPLSHIRVLIHLYQHGPLCMGDLARGLGIAYSTATECVAGLETHGRVIRDRSATDRRQVVVRLTPEAEEVAFQVHAQRRLILERVLRRLSPTEGRAFVKGLAHLALEAEAWMDQVPAPEGPVPAVGARRG